MDAQPSSSRPPPGRLAPEQTRRVNLVTHWWQDIYQNALTLSWPAFMLCGCGLYVAVNAVFAILYLVQPGAIAHARAGSFADAFFFSVQCISTIGFGNLLPATLYANILVTAEAIVSLAIVALSTGLVFARFSRPRARVLFARAAVIAPHNGVPTLLIRIGNARLSQILSAEVSVSALRPEQTSEGETFRRFYDLALARSRTPIFALTFTLMHTINEASPLYGTTVETLVEEGTDLLVTVTGLEETTSQIVHARHMYGPEDIRWGHRFRDVFAVDQNGTPYIDYGWFHDTEPAVAREPGEVSRQPTPSPYGP